MESWVVRMLMHVSGGKGKPRGLNVVPFWVVYHNP